MIRVISIREGDYGCEERPEGAPLMCNVEIDKDGSDKYFNIPDKMADDMGLVEKEEISEEIFSEIEHYYAAHRGA